MLITGPDKIKKMLYNATSTSTPEEVKVLYVGSTPVYTYYPQTIKLSDDYASPVETVTSWNSEEYAYKESPSSGSVHNEVVKTGRLKVPAEIVCLRSHGARISCTLTVSATAKTKVNFWFWPGGTRNPGDTAACIRLNQTKSTPLESTKVYSGRPSAPGVGNAELSETATLTLSYDLEENQSYIRWWLVMDAIRYPGLNVDTWHTVSMDTISVTYKITSPAQLANQR